VSNLQEPRATIPDASPQLGPMSREKGFSLVEALVAIFIFGIGMMFVGRMIFDSVGINVLARSKGAATITAENRMEILAAKYRANAADSDLTLGSHGPTAVEFVNPVDNTKLNRFNVAWTVANVPDPRTGKVLKAVQVTVTVTPIGSGTSANNKAGMNKVISLTSIFSFRQS
jgi:prepilin-type N-terminal cleavage/methylation domain-containing protein